MTFVDQAAHLVISITPTLSYRKVKILFVSHSASLSGAPLLLLDLVKWLKREKKIKCAIILREGGELETRFAKLGPTWLITEEDAPNAWHDQLRNQFTFKKRARKQRINEGFVQKLKEKGFDIVYSNTITNGEILHQLSPLKVPVVTHVHELASWIQMSGDQNLSLVKKYSDAYIAASQAVNSELTLRRDIPEAKTSVIYEFVPTHVALAQPKDLAGLRKQLGISTDTFVIVGSGIETFRKGKDLFIDVAAELVNRNPGRKIVCVWVGAWQHPAHEEELKSKAENLNLAGVVRFVGQVSNPLDYFSLADVFAMTSREDPYPLVCLEAATLGVPIICFRNAGGICEFVENDAGIAVPEIDVKQFTDSVELLMGDNALRWKLGRQAQEKVMERHTIDKTAENIYELIEALTQVGKGKRHACEGA